MPLDATSTLDTAMLPVELTLIVAATREMGIGRAGALPWTGLKKEMAYFARVTKRVGTKPSNDTAGNPQALMNAVIMGRKTWDSIPERFRPLKGRLNVVLSRSSPYSPWDGSGSDREPIKLPSLTAALEGLSQSRSIDKVFVIGGAEIYKAALEAKEARRILLTRILTPFECDTIFPIKLGENRESEWKKKEKVELDQWVQETVPDGLQEESGVIYSFEMYERQQLAESCRSRDLPSHGPT